MKRLNSTTEIIRATGSVREPYLDSVGEKIGWLNSLPWNADAIKTDYGVYVRIQGSMPTELDESTYKSYSFPYFEIYRKDVDRHGNPCYSIRDVLAINDDNVLVSIDVSWLCYDPDNDEIKLTSIDPTQD
jgi:hypothetical protein